MGQARPFADIKNSELIVVRDHNRTVRFEIPGNAWWVDLAPGVSRHFAQAILDAAEAVDGIKAVVRMEDGDG